MERAAPWIHCFNKRRIVMTSGLTLFLLVLLYGLLGSVYSSALRSNHINSTKHSLELVHVVFRHGPRTPADTYPKDPHINETFFPYGWGHITNDGKRLLFNIGLWLRKRYNDHLGTLYQPDILHAQATGVSRTHMSLATVLAGLWLPRNTPMEWNPRLNWQPIPIFSQALDEDTLLLVRTSCPRYYEALDEVFQRPEVKSVLEDNKMLFDELTEKTGLNITTPDDVQSLYSTLLAEKDYGLSLPAWTKEYFPDKMQSITEISYEYNVYTNELKKIKAGPFLKKMITEWKDKSEDKLKPEKRKLFIYTGHDSTVVNILAALNIWQRQFPYYAIMALFELYKNNESGEYHVEVYLKNNTRAEPHPLTIPGCDFACPLHKVISLANEVLPDGDVASQCKSNNPDFTEPPIGGP